MRRLLMMRTLRKRIAKLDARIEKFEQKAWSGYRRAWDTVPTLLMIRRRLREDLDNLIHPKIQEH